ncbi:cell wall-binding repeat-containing protein, partial [Citroniella saccharovorans]|uniref:cell wall-binding repeat-containing protein n=1 Tax=Citroniella saccharovorans TaxID=2053367 RepID=UPI003621BB2A
KLILANGQSLVDALTASSLAQVEDRAVILVNKEEIPKVAKELVEKAKDILIVGGENSVKLGVKADRISGKDRFETAVKIAERAFTEPKQIALANSTAYADALVFGGVTGKVEAPILLTNKDKLPQVVKEYLERNKIEKIFVLGGENSVSENLFK